MEDKKYYEYDAFMDAVVSEAEIKCKNIHRTNLDHYYQPHGCFFLPLMLLLSLFGSSTAKFYLLTHLPSKERAIAGIMRKYEEDFHNKRGNRWCIDKLIEQLSNELAVI